MRLFPSDLPGICRRRRHRRIHFLLRLWFGMGVRWFIVRRLRGVLSFLVLTSLCALLVHVTGTKSAGEKKNSVQQAIVGITLGITVLSPFVSVAAAIGYHGRVEKFV